MVPVALSFTVLRRFHSASDFGLVLGAQAVTTVGALFFAGIIGDRAPRKRLVMGADITVGLMRVMMAVAALLSIGGLGVFLVAELVIGAALSMFFPAYEGWFQAVIPIDLRQEANALRSIYWNTGNILGPAVAGLIAALFLPAWALLASGLLPLVASLIFVRLPPDLSHQSRDSVSIMTDLREGWRAFSSRRWIWSVDLQFSLWHILAYAPLVVLGPVIALEYYHGAAGWGAIWGSVAVGGVGGGLLAFRARGRYPLRGALLALLATVTIMCALAWHLSIWLVLLAGAISGLGLEYFSSLWTTLMQNHVPPEVMSKVTSFDWLASSGLLPVGYALSIPLSQWIGRRGVLLAGGLYIVVSTLLVLLVPEVRRLPRRPEVL
jgi:MFS family permease